MNSLKPLHDYTRSRAVLVGTADYTHLQPVPAAANSLERMKGLLTSHLCGWPGDAVSVFRDEPGPGDLPDRLITIFEEATEVALFYFVGHGQVDLDDQLCLGLVGSRPDVNRRATTSLQFSSVRRALQASRATTKIVILDCCFAGLAKSYSNTLGNATGLLDKAGGTGAYMMAACSAYSTAWFEKRAKQAAQTYFTKYLADLIETGIPGETSTLRLGAIFERVQENLQHDRRPRPEDRNIDRGGDFVFAHNAAPAQTDAESGQQLMQLSEILVILSRRSQSLVERQIKLIDELEQGEQDPDRLASLFQIDHISTRMRRYSENLLVLAGFESSRRWIQPVPLVDALRAAISEIEQYERVTLNVQPGISVRGPAVNDLVHLIAELAENATSFSLPDTPVRVSGLMLVSGGVLLDITDEGVGMGSDEIAYENWRLDNPPVLDVSVSRRMGLFVVARLAARHGIRVRLRPASRRGLTALVWLPDEIVMRDAEQEVNGRHRASQ